MRALGMLVVVLLTCGVAPPSASAEKHVVVDGPGDAWARAVGGETWSETGWSPNVDVRRMVLDHGKDSISLRTKYVNLRDWVSEEIELDFEFRTDGGGRFGGTIWVFWDGHSAGSYLTDAEGLPLRCRQARSGTSFARNTVWLSVPRSCFDDPRWVSFRGYASSYDSEFVDYYRDAVPGDGHELDAWSPRVRRN